MATNNGASNATQSSLKNSADALQKVFNVPVTKEALAADPATKALGDSLHAEMVASNETQSSLQTSADALQKVFNVPVTKEELAAHPATKALGDSLHAEMLANRR
jgi:hypothetical protein